MKLYDVGFGGDGLGDLVLSGVDDLIELLEERVFRGADEEE